MNGQFADGRKMMRSRCCARGFLFFGLSLAWLCLSQAALAQVSGGKSEGTAPDTGQSANPGQPVKTNDTS